MAYIWGGEKTIQLVYISYSTPPLFENLTISVCRVPEEERRVFGVARGWPWWWRRCSSSPAKWIGSSVLFPIPKELVSSAARIDFARGAGRSAPASESCARYDRSTAATKKMPQSMLLQQWSVDLACVWSIPAMGRPMRLSGAAAAILAPRWRGRTSTRSPILSTAIRLALFNSSAHTLV